VRIRETSSPDQVKVGETITVTAGEKIPLDGEIIAGTSQVDTNVSSKKAETEKFITKFLAV
jgi:cation transport ATPase